MRVAMYYNNRDVRIEEIPVPAIGSGELLVKIIASGICGSDVLEWYRVRKAPIVLGHEIAGEVVKVGEGVERFRTGDRVFIGHHVPCNTCRYCRAGHHTVCRTLHTTNFDPGGFADYVRAPSINVERGTFILPEEVSWEAGSFVEPLACVVRGQRVAGFRPGMSVLVLGSGISGLLHIMLARAQGAGRIIATDINPWRVQMAKNFGADHVLDAREDVPARVRELNGGYPAELVIVCAGELSAFKQALASVDRGGTVLTFATTDPGVEIPLPANEFWRNSIRVMPSYANSPYDAEVAIELLRAGRVDVEPLITHRLGLEETAEGFRLMAESATEKSIKVVILPHG
ncbi:MAG: alcohol dehydrogenase catalytic domain-containing protein [Candidatus Glassbacteria bacterium]|nr:alcohol dehydrogenase catalytic domain-containing protein [Candidatus Glassbacteria bacterium]